MQEVESIAMYGLGINSGATSTAKVQGPEEGKKKKEKPPPTKKPHLKNLLSSYDTIFGKGQYFQLY